MLRARIIILNYNGEEILPKCLPSLVESSRQAKHPTAVTVLDNRSDDKSIDWVRKHFPEVKVVVTPENRFLVSFNDYVKEIDDDVVLLLNNDLRVDRDFIDPLVEVFEKYPDAFLASPQDLTFDGTRYQGGRSRGSIRYGLFWSSCIFPGYEVLKDKPGYTFAAGYGAFHRKRFLALGGYDDLYLPGIVEDADLGFRAWREGFRSYYVPQSRAYHIGQASFKKAFGEKGILRLAHRNGFLFIWKNITDPVLLLKHFALLVPRLLFSSARGQTELVEGFFQALGKVGEAVRRRKFSLKRARSDREIFRLANGEQVRRRYLFKSWWKRVLIGLLDGVGALFYSLFVSKGRLKEDPKKILVARIDSLGDGVLSLPAIEALRKRFPKAEVDFLVSPPVEELYRKLFPNSRIYRFEKNWLTSSAPWIERLSEAAKLLKEIKSRSYDLGVDFRGDLRTLLLLAGAGIKHRWGRGGTGGGFLLSGQTESGYEGHELLENMELIQSNGKLPKIEFPQIKPASASVQSVADRLRSFGSKKKIVIHIGAGYPSKCWSTAKYAELARGIVQKGLGVPLFSGSEKDRALLDTVRENLPAESLDFTGKTSLEELLALLEQADLFIGNDSGPAHLAALLGRKLVVIFSGTNDYRRWAPWTERLRVVNRPVPCSPCEEKVCPLSKQVCLEEISVEEVFGAAEEMLEG